MSANTWDDIINQNQEIDGRPANMAYYEYAYNNLMLKIWKNTEFKADIPELSYQKAMNVFGQTGQLAEKSRRNLAYNYLKCSNFSVKNAADIINSMYPTLPTSNAFVARVIRNIANVFINKPLREFPEGTESKLMQKILLEAKYETTMLNGYRKAKLGGECLFRPRIRREKLSYQLLTAESYRLKKDEHGNIMEYWRPFWEMVVDPATNAKTSKLRFEVWTLKDFTVRDGEKEDLPPVEFTRTTGFLNLDTSNFEDQTEKFTSYPNPYRDFKGNPIIPIAILNFSQNDDDGTEGTKDNFELTKAQLESNLMDFLTKENYIYNSVGIWKMVNIPLEKEGIPWGNSRGIHMEDIEAETEGGLAFPDIEHISAEGVYDQLVDTNKTILDQRMRDAGLPESLVSQNPGLAASGAAMRMDWKELFETRKEDYDCLKAFENELINLTALFLNVDPSSKHQSKFKQEFVISIDYVEQVSDEWADKRDRLEHLRSNGLITVKEYTEQMAAIDTLTSDEQAIEYTNNNLQQFEKVKNGRRTDQPGTEPTITEPSSSEPSGSEGQESD